VLSGLDCRITKGDGTLDKRSDSFGGRDCGCRRDRWAGRGSRQRGLDRDNADLSSYHYNTSNNANNNDPW